tara:strand:+ start:119 stop:505 length:387 start_codon:yes stop_codon:yes gene_type:complete
MVDNEITEKIGQLLNNGFVFPEHLTKKERNEVEEELVEYYNKTGFRAFMEEEMLYVSDLNYKIIMMIEITRNSIYFNSQEHVYLLDAVVATLEFITKKYSSEEEQSTEDIENEITEDIPKTKPDFGTL